MVNPYPFPRRFTVRSYIFISISIFQYSEEEEGETRSDQNTGSSGNLAENVSLSETVVTHSTEGFGSILSSDPLFLDIPSTSGLDSIFKVPEPLSGAGTPGASPADSSKSPDNRLD